MKKISLSTSLVFMLAPIISISILIVFFLSVRTVTSYLDTSKGDYAMSLAKIVSNMPEVKAAFKAKDPSSIIQPIVENIRSYTNAEFIVVMNMNSVRYSHSNPSLIGEKFTGGDEGRAMHGESYVSKATGISGKSERAFTPIYDGDKQIGVVAVGFYDNALESILKGLTTPIRMATLFGIALSIWGALIISFYIKKQIFGLEPWQIAMILKERETMLQSMKDGILSINTKGDINVINDEAKRILGISDDMEIIGKPVEDYIPNSRLKLVMETQEAEYDREQLLNNCIIITNRVPIIVDNKVVGAMAFFRDKTDVFKIAEELTGVKEYAEALRARSHEFINKLQTVGGLIELGDIDKALNLISATSQVQQDRMNTLVQQFKSPEIVGILLGKISRAVEEGIELSISSDSHLEELPFYFDSNSMITVIGNLIQNSLDCLKAFPREKKRINLSIHDGDYIEISVSNNGPKIPEEITDRILEKGFTTKGEGHGIGLYLVNNLVNSVYGAMEIYSDDFETKFVIKIPRGEIYEQNKGLYN